MTEDQKAAMLAAWQKCYVFDSSDPSRNLFKRTRRGPNRIGRRGIQLGMCALS
jgi:hypothetical protein